MLDPANAPEPVANPQDAVLCPAPFFVAPSLPVGASVPPGLRFTSGPPRPKCKQSSKYPRLPAEYYGDPGM